MSPVGSVCPDCSPSGTSFSEQVSSGGMTSVWRGHDRVLGGDVVVKVLTPARHRPALPVPLHRGGHQRRPPDPTRRRRPLRHRRAGRRRLHRDGAGQRADAARGHRPPRPAPAVAAARLSMEVSAALDYAHQAGVCHGSLKPGNILLADDGTVKVADFSIARAATEDDPGRTGEVLGADGNLAPEVVRATTPTAGPTSTASEPAVRDAHRPAPRCRPVHHHPAPCPAGRGAARPGHDRPPGDGRRPRRPLPDRPGHGRRPLPLRHRARQRPVGRVPPHPRRPDRPRGHLLPGLPPPRGPPPRLGPRPGRGGRHPGRGRPHPGQGRPQQPVRRGHAGEDPREPDDHRQRQPHPGRRPAPPTTRSATGASTTRTPPTRSTGTRPAPGRPTATRAPSWAA